MRFSSKTFKRRSLKKRSKRTKKLKGQKRQKKQRGGSPGSALYRDIPKEATFSDVMPNPLD